MPQTSTLLRERSKNQEDSRICLQADPRPMQTGSGQSAEQVAETTVVQVRCATLREQTQQCRVILRPTTRSREWRNATTAAACSAEQPTASEWQGILETAHRTRNATENSPRLHHILIQGNM